MLNSFAVNREPVLLGSVPALADDSDRTVLVLRHSIRESLRAGSVDPDLTPEGVALAERCGRLLAGLGNDVFFAASPRTRTRRTAQCMLEGGGFPRRDVRDCPELGDLTIFSRPVDFEAMLRDHNTVPVMREYYSTGHAEGLKDMRPFAEELLRFLTGTPFPASRTVIVSHDVLAMAILSALGVRSFTIEDWCGYLHGVLLTRGRDGIWTAAYAVPDFDAGKKHRLFV
ncbi:MAG: phosphoglycerate mutase family protein [Lentisphaeria bacterium]|nr:phosphoglycerate mutase family protein [Lentisphaeria bacterium]